MIIIYEEQRMGAIAETVEHSNASLGKCLEIIERMDGFNCNQVTVECADNIIMIGGGDDDYIVTVETNTAIHNLLNPLTDEQDEALEADSIELTVGGQVCEFPQQYIVDIELVKSALLQYLVGEPSNIRWETIEK